MKEPTYGKKRIHKACPVCNGGFVTNHPQVKYCSEPCYKKQLKQYELSRKEARKKYYDLPKVRERMRAHWRKYKREKYSTPEGRKQTLECQKRYRRNRA